MKNPKIAVGLGFYANEVSLRSGTCPDLVSAAFRRWIRSRAHFHTNVSLKCQNASVPPAHNRGREVYQRPRHSESAAKIIGIISEVKEERDFDRLLAGNLKVLDQRTVGDVLKSLRNIRVLLGFFDWVGKQRGYQHSLVTYNCLLDALGRANASTVAYERYHQMQKRGYTPDDYTYSIMVRGFCKSGDLERAYEMVQNILDAGKHPHLITYSILVDGYCKAGKMDRALELFKSMCTPCKPDVITYNTLLKGLCTARRLDEAFVLFDHMSKTGCEPNVISYTTLLDGLCKSERLDEACTLMDEMYTKGRMPDLITYTTLITALCRASRVPEACSRFREMVARDRKPDPITFSTLISILCKAGKGDNVQKLLVDMVRSCFKNMPESEKETEVEAGLPEVTELGRLVGMKPDLSTFHVLVCCYCMSNRVGTVLGYFKSVQGVIPHAATYSVLVEHASRTEGLLDDAYGLFTDMISRSRFPSPELCAILIHGLCKASRLSEALSVFNRLSTMKDFYSAPNLSTYNVLVDGLSKGGRLEEAENMISDMVNAGLRPNSVTYSALIDGFCKAGKLDKAGLLLEEMNAKGIPPDAYTDASVLNALCKAGNIDYALQHVEVMKARGSTPDIVTYNTLMDGLSKAGRVSEAVAFLEKMVEIGGPDVVSYTIIISGLFSIGEPMGAYYVYEQMVKKGCIPDRILYNALVGGLVDAGKVDLATEVVKGRLCRLDLGLYSKVVDGLCKSGDADGAVRVVREMSDAGYPTDTLLTEMGRCEVVTESGDAVNAEHKEEP